MRLTATGTLGLAGIGILSASADLNVLAQAIARGRGVMVGSGILTATAQGILVGSGAGTNQDLFDSIIADGTIALPSRFSSGGTAVEYIDDPDTSSESSVSNQTELDAAIALGSNRRIIVNSGSYSFLAVQNGQTDLDFVLANDAVFSSGIFVGHSSNGASHRIRISGGAFGGGISVHNTCSHVLFHNVRSDAGGSYLNEGQGGAQDHIAYVDCTIDTNSSGNYGILSGVTTHLWILRCDIANDWPDVAGVRLVQPQKVIALQNRIYSSGNRAWRVHAGTVRDADLILTMDNLFLSDDDNAHNIWYGPAAGGPAHSNAITRVESHYDSYYSEVASSNSECVTIDHDQAGGCDDFTFTNFTGRSPNTVLDDGGHPTNWTTDEIDLDDYEDPPETPAFAYGADH